MEKSFVKSTPGIKTVRPPGDICFNSLGTIGSDNGLALTNGQAIIWTKDDLLTHISFTRSASMSQLKS